MDIEVVRDLIQLMVDNDLAELEVQDGETRVSLKRRGQRVETANVVAVTPGELAAPAPPEVGPESEAAPPKPSDADKGEQLVEIKSPMVGTFYVSADPESPPFVQAGSHVEPDTVVCVIEAMKVYNEIRAETAGVIEKVLVRNEEAVEFGQPLFLVRPVDRD